ncbi:MAG: YebC/PmpR family DNA-binding transcriptional regulator [Deltaproteobacteria bacterium]|nr:YebC/PmpR family DNA-binding transcriptional regulator [Deltaproteobacteria bacterium]
MAGHSKFKNIMHRKGAQDKKRSSLFSKLSKEITVAAKMGGPDPAGNPRLRKALDEARSANLGKEPIQRALAKSSSKEGSADYEELTYEGYGPGGVALLVACLTDNRNRTYSEVRAAINKNGGNLGTPGSVAFGFQKKGQILIDKAENKNLTEDQLLEWGLESGLEELEQDPEGFEITCSTEAFLDLKEALEKQKIQMTSAEVAMIADNPVELDDDKSETLEKITDALEDLDDVQKVWTSEA